VLDPEASRSDAAVSAASLRHVMTEFASGVTVVTTDWQGMDHAMTATAFCSVSLAPPLVLVCVGKSSRFHEAVIRSQSWAASLLAADQGWIARHFAHRGRDLLSQFATVPYTRAPSSNAPLITGAQAWLDCSTYAVHDGGDHTIVVGLVVGAIHGSTARAPLTYLRGAYSDAT
jgi:flavin reductase